MPRMNRNLLVICGALLTANILHCFPSPIGSVITLGFFLFVPGLLILKAMKLKDMAFWVSTPLSIALSILVLMLAGFALNSTSLLGLSQPLTTLNIFITLDAVTLFLILLSRKNLPNVSNIIRFPRLRGEELTVLGASVLMPMLAVLGAIRLNNGAPSSFTLLLLGLIALVLIWIFIRKDLGRLYPLVLLSCGISILFTVSLRGSNVTGSDIQREFFVFHLTYLNSLWDMSSFRDPYNACLSITILPTILAKITTLSDTAVYKVIFQIIFAFCIPAIYSLLKVFTKRRAAFMGAFLFIAFPLFIGYMPMINRQEIAFLFFTLLLLVNFTSSFPKKQKLLLSLLLLLGIILAHYSTSYVTLAALLLGMLIYRLLRSKKSSLAKNSISPPPAFRLKVWAIALLVTFLWNAQLTGTSQGLQNTVSKTISNLFDESASDYLTYNPLGKNVKAPEDLLERYTSEHKSTEASTLVYVSNTVTPLTSIGKVLSRYGLDPLMLNKLLKDFAAVCLQLLLVLGLVIMFLKRKKDQNMNPYFLSLCISGGLLLSLLTLLPLLTSYYGVNRLFQQFLVVFSLPIITALMFIFSRGGKLKNFLLASFMSFIFLILSGFWSQVIGGYTPSIQLNNRGEDYNSYVVHEPEMASSQWLTNLAKGSDKILKVSADDFSRLRLLGPITSNELEAETMLESSNSDVYAYNSVGNTETGTYQVAYGAGRLRFQLTPSLEFSKNNVYTAGKSKIYK